MGDLVEPRPFQRSDEGGARAEGLFTVHTLHGEAGQASRMHQVRQRGRGALKGIGVPRPRQRGAPATFQVDDQFARVHDDQGASFTARAMLTGIRPRQRGTIRVGRIGGGEHQGLGRASPAGRLAGSHRPQPVDCARGRELGRPQPLYEIAAPQPASILRCREHLVDACETTVDTLGLHRSARDDAVAVQ